MNPELSKALTDLALRLGTSADKFFPMLVAKAKLDATLAVWGFGIGAVLGFAVIALLIYAVIKWEWDEITLVPLAITATITVIFLCCSIGSIGDYRYPEAAALQSLVHCTN